MQIKLLFIILLVFLNFSSWGQETVFSYPESGNKNYSISSTVIADKKNKTLCLVLKDNTKIEYFLLSSDFKVLSKFSHPGGLVNSVYKYEYQSLIETVVNNAGINFIYSVRDKSIPKGDYQMLIETVNFEKKEVATKNFFLINTGEQWTVSKFNNAGKYYQILADDETDELIINILSEENKIEKKQIKFNLKEFYSVKKMSLSDYFSYSHSFGSSEETGLKESSDLAKFFWYPDKVTILVTNLKEPPHILKLDLKTYILTKKKLSMEGFCGYESKKQTSYNNSYVFDNRLYVLNVCNDFIEIGIFDPETGTLIKKHQISESDESFFSNDISSSKTIGKKEKEKELKVKELIKKMMRGSVGIAAAKNSNGDIALTCGTYDETIVGGGGYYIGGFSTTARPTGSVYSGSNVPVTRPMSTFDPNKNYAKTKSSKATFVTTFRLVLNDKNFDIINSEQVETRYDIMKNYSENFQPQAQARNFFSFNNKFYFGFYDDIKKQFVIQYLEDDK